jgi:hypothetical protein
LSERPHALPRILGASAVTLVGGTTLIGGQAAHANDPINVTNLDPSGPGSLFQALLDAKNNEGPDTITFASALEGTISLSASYGGGGLYGNYGTLPIINDDLTITGPGSGLVTIDGLNDIYGIFSNFRRLDGMRTYDVDLTVSGLTITNSALTGIRIREANPGGSSLALTDVTVTNNAYTGVSFKGRSLDLTDVDINNNGGFYGVQAELTGDEAPSVTITDSTMASNQGNFGAFRPSFEGGSVTITNSSFEGGTYASGIAVSGVETVTITDTIASYNYAHGLMINFAETATISDSTFSHNNQGGSEYHGLDLNGVDNATITNVTASYNYVGLYALSYEAGTEISISDSTFSNNVIGLYVRGLETATLSNVTASYNDEDGAGFNGAGSVTVQNSTFTSNDESGLAFGGTTNSIEITGVTSSDNGNSGLFVRDWSDNPIVAEVSVVDSTFDGNYYGVFIQGPAAAIERVTISNTTTYGVIADGVEVTLTNSTITSSGGSGIQLRGQYAYDELDNQIMVGSDLTVAHSTITGNTNHAVDGINNSEEYDLAFAHDITIDHSIVSGNDGDDVVNDSEANAAPNQGSTTVAWSIVDDGSAHAAGTGNVEADDPMLGALADNGGETLTMLPADDSPAVDAGNPSITGAPTTDQRGVNRIQGTAIDIGAVEVAQATPVPTPAGAIADPAQVAPGSRFKAKGRCRGSETVEFTFRSEKKTATCTSPDLTSGLARPADAGYTGFAEVEFTAPATPGAYEVEVVLLGSGESYVIGVTVNGATTPTTTTPVGTLPATGSNGRTGLIAGLLAGLGTAMTLGASRRRRTN